MIRGRGEGPFEEAPGGPSRTGATETGAAGPWELDSRAGPALDRLAGVLAASGGAALLLDDRGLVRVLRAEAEGRRALADAGIVGAARLLDVPLRSGVPVLNVPGALSSAVAVIRSGEVVEGYVAALVPVGAVSDPSSLYEAASLTAHAVEDAIRAAAADERAARAEAHVRGVVASAPDPVVLVDDGAIVLEANALAVRLLGAGLVPGRDLFEVLGGSGLVDRRSLAALRRLEAPAVVATEIRLGRGAQARPYLVELSPVRREGKVTARVVRFRSQQDAARVAAGSRALADAERRTLVLALEETRWNISETARRLGVTRPTVYSMIRRHKVAPGVR